MAEVGTHDELMRADGVYKQLVLLQSVVDETEGTLDEKALLDMTETEKRMTIILSP